VSVNNNAQRCNTHGRRVIAAGVGTGFFALVLMKGVNMDAVSSPQALARAFSLWLR